MLNRIQYLHIKAKTMCWKRGRRWRQASLYYSCLVMKDARIGTKKRTIMTSLYVLRGWAGQRRKKMVQLMFRAWDKNSPSSTSPLFFLSHCCWLSPQGDSSMRPALAWFQRAWGLLLMVEVRVSEYAKDKVRKLFAHANVQRHRIILSCPYWMYTLKSRLNALVRENPPHWKLWGLIRD